MTDADPRTFSEDFRRFFLRGLVVLLPSVLTLWIVVKAYQFVDTAIAEPINRGVRLTLSQSAHVWEPLRRSFDPTPELNEKWKTALAENPSWRGLMGTPDEPVELTTLRTRLRGENLTTWWRERWYMDLIGLGIAIVVVYVAGRLLGGFFGRQLYKRIESLITTLPVFKQVYPYVKQIVDFLFSDDQPIKFNRVVAVEYPRKGIWSVGFLTGRTLRHLSEQTPASVTVFIPSSPTPFTGYTITVAPEDTIELPLSVEEAIRFAVSGGVLIPEHQRDLSELTNKTGLRPLAPGAPVTPAQPAPETRDPA